jgi:hypothetical protein
VHDDIPMVYSDGEEGKCNSHIFPE